MQCSAEVEYFLGLIPESKQSFQGLIDHVSLKFQSCETASSLIGDFYNQSQNCETEYMFVGELQVLMRKIMAQKSEFLGEENQVLKHQFTHNLRDSYF